MELDYHQRTVLLQRFPSFELSYETVLHNKVEPPYNLALAIALGKKCYAWFTFEGVKHVCYIMELNKDKKISKITKCNAHYHSSLCIGTVLYGTLVDVIPPTPDPDLGETPETHTHFFIADDIYFFRGIPLKQMCFSDRLPHLHTLFKKYIMQTSPEINENAPYMNVVFAMAAMWKPDAQYPQNIIPATQHLGYTAHHIQYRAISKIAPYLNIPIAKPSAVGGNVVLPTRVPKLYKPHFCHYHKPQYKEATLFMVKADIQFDVYHLYAYGKNKELVYYNVPGIQTYKTSVFMNKIFRKIRENQNIDYIEESEDEDDFQDLREDKYVDLEKTVPMECVFEQKLRLWVPIKVVDIPAAQIVHISQL